MSGRPKNADEMAKVARRRPKAHPVFKGRDFSVREDLCFVLMPFKREMKPVYEDHIRKVVTGLGLECQRADDLFRPTVIIEDIWEGINRARIIIADLTGKNPNVFYEVGVAHTLGKDVILITQSIKDVPFDLHHVRHIRYEYTPPGMKEFERQLKSTVLNVLG